jgi:hypothetical protein
MNDRNRNNQLEGARRPYTKPHIQEVPLRPEEAVLGACKTATASGPAQAKCTFPSSCSSPKS